jgi:glutamate 5-kinase
MDQTPENDVLFRRSSRNNSQLLSIRVMDEKEHENNHNMMDSTSHNLAMSRAITIINEADTSKMIV